MTRGRTLGTATGQPTVAELVVRYKSMVVTGRAFAPMAAENLDYWLSKKGGTRHLPTSYFQHNAAVNSHLAEIHRNMFLSKIDASKGVVPRIRRNPIPFRYDLSWEDSMYARPLTDLYFGLGGFTIKSTVVIDVVPTTGRTSVWDVQFVSWRAQIFDDYNWDNGKSVDIPGWGRIDDADAIRVEKAGLAKSYKIESAPWFVTLQAVNGPAQVRV